MRQPFPQNQVRPTARLRATVRATDAGLFRSRLSPIIPLDGEARLPAASARIRAHIPRPLPSNPASPIRASLQLALRALPRVRARV